MTKFFRTTKRASRQLPALIRYLCQVFASRYRSAGCSAALRASPRFWGAQRRRRCPAAPRRPADATSGCRRRTGSATAPGRPSSRGGADWQSAGPRDRPCRGSGSRRGQSDVLADCVRGRFLIGFVGPGRAIDEPECVCEGAKGAGNGIGQQDHPPPGTESQGNKSANGPGEKAKKQEAHRSVRMNI